MEVVAVEIRRGERSSRVIALKNQTVVGRQRGSGTSQALTENTLRHRVKSAAYGRERKQRASRQVRKNRDKYLKAISTVF